MTHANNRNVTGNPQVAVVSRRDVGHYPDGAPFHPSEAYPECPFPERSDRPNPIYDMVRQALSHLGLDRANFGTPAWNPIGDFVKPGAKIVLKPNWVLHRNQGAGGTDCLLTHPSVLRAVLDYAILARPAEIVIGDAPVQGCRFDELLRLGPADVIAFVQAKGVNLRLVDFRRTVRVENEGLYDVREEVQPLDRYTLVDLGARSHLEPVSSGANTFRVTMYDPRKMKANHAPGRHRYLVARDALEADLVLNLPKLKTHKKAGITAALKNLVGINGNKDYLPHHRKGPVVFGGDNYERFSPVRSLAEEILDLANRHLQRPKLYRFLTRIVYHLMVLDIRLGGMGEVEGSWYGNDTVWRMSLDLTRILMYADAEGRMHDAPVRRMLSVADGVIGGEGQGPLKSDPRRLGVIVAGLNPAAVDRVAALLMGLNPDAIPIIAHAFQGSDLPLTRFPPGDIRCTTNGSETALADLFDLCGAPFAPADGWKGHCERS